MRRVAVITRTKNRPLLLRRALRSVLAQSFADWEQIVVNDGGAAAPVDEEVRAIADPRVRVVHHEYSQGMEAASNSGLQASQSEYCVIHDDDDSWSPDFLAQTVARLTQRERPAAVVTHSTLVMERIEGHHVVEIERRPFNVDLHAVDLLSLAFQNRFPPISFVFSRAVLEKIGGYDDKMPVLGDWDFNLRFAREADIAVLPVELANYHQRPLETSVYGNSLYAASHQHHITRAYLVNKLLREGTALPVALGCGVALGEMSARVGSMLGDAQRMRERAFGMVTRVKGILPRRPPIV